MIDSGPRFLLGALCATLVLATECIVGGIMGALRLQPFLGLIEHLRYPPYFMTILGVVPLETRA